MIAPRLSGSLDAVAVAPLQFLPAT
jgi:hypothetical protein